MELATSGLKVCQQLNIPVYYQGAMVGDYYADMLVHGRIIVELKAAEYLKSEHFAQLTHYLKATEMEVGLLLNFGKKAEFKRIIFTNDLKQPRYREEAEALS